MARRRGRIVNREKTRITKLTEGVNFSGVHLVKRRSPNTGQWVNDIFPSPEAQRPIRPRIKYFTKRRAPRPPDEFVRPIHQAVRGGANYYPPTNASPAFRALQRFSNTRFRRYLTLLPQLELKKSISY